MIFSQCETMSENVCIDVTETKCEVVPYKECKMGLEEMKYTEKKLAPKLFEEKSCYQGKKKVPHTKLFPNCRNVTKQSKLPPCQGEALYSPWQKSGLVHRL